MIEALDSYCTRYPLVPVRVSSPGGRGLNESLRKFEVREERMLASKTNDICLQASLADANALAVDEEYEQKVITCGAATSAHPEGFLISMAAKANRWGVFGSALRSECGPRYFCVQRAPTGA
ncbi:hypothetical protein FGB62_186g021 [Gracilaria domingensis]|nr:hypothetical protein FGB62_186g021 [Gracilaria domingensis]